jgi:hypothetical protein
MALSRPFAYNTGASISGTTQFGDLIVGDVDVDYSSDYGGVKWWGGPDEDLRWIIGNARPSGQPIPPGVVGTARVGFWGSKPIGIKTDETFLSLADYVGSKNGQPPFANADAANNWLNSNGYYSNYVIPSPTPTSTLGLTPTPTPSVTSTLTPTITETPTNTPTVTPTITPTITTSPTETPTNTPTPSVTPQPVTGYGYNLVVLPYAPPTSGNTIFPTFATPGLNSGTTNPNTFNVNGVYWNALDNLSVDRTSYFSGMTGVSVTAYFTQNGDTSIYSGSSTAFVFDGASGQESFNYNPNSRPGQLVLIQSASTNFVTGQTVYISYIFNESVTPTPTPTNTVTPTITNTSSPTVTPTPTTTETPTNTPTNTETPTPTVTETPTNTPTVTITPSTTSAPACDITGNIIDPTPTPTPTQTVTPTNTVTPTITPTITPTPSPVWRFIIENANTTRSVTNADINGVTQTLEQGSYPLLNSNGYSTSHGTATGTNPDVLQFTFGGTGSFTTFQVFKNGTLFFDLPGYSSGVMTCGGMTIATNDIIKAVFT